MANPDPTRATHEERPEGAGPAATEWLGEAAERLVRPYAELLADRIEAAAAGLRTAAQQMAREDEPSAVADSLRRTAEHGEALADCARHEPVDQLADRTAEFARARPAVFLGAAAAAGWAIGLALQRRTARQARSAGPESSASHEMQQSPHDAQEKTQP